MPRWELEAHDPACPKSFQACCICKELAPHGCMEDHRELKAVHHVQLLEAKLLEKDGDHVEDAIADLRRRLTDVETAVKRTAKTDYVKNVWTS